MQSLITERRNYQRLAAQALGREVRSPRIFVGHLHDDAVPTPPGVQPLDPKQTGVVRAMPGAP